MSNEALEGIRVSAAAIYDERKRLNEVFDSLREAARILDPTVTLLDDGSLKRVGEPVQSQTATTEGAVTWTPHTRSKVRPLTPARAKKALDRVENFVRKEPQSQEQLLERLRKEFGSNYVTWAIKELLEKGIIIQQGDVLTSTKPKPAREQPKEFKQQRLNQREQAEDNLKQILEWVNKRTAEGNPDIDSLTYSREHNLTAPKDRARIGYSFRTLQERGEIRRLGMYYPSWKKKGENTGRTTARYVAARPKPVEVPSVTLEQVRNSVIKLGFFTLDDLAKDLKVATTDEKMADHLRELVMKGVIKPAGDLRWQYNPPKPNAPTTRPRTDPNPARTAAASAPVAHTNKRHKTPHRETQALLDQLAKKPMVEVSTLGNHGFNVRNTVTGQRLTIAGTPGSSNLTKTKAQLRRIGIDVV